MPRKHEVATRMSAGLALAAVSVCLLGGRDRILRAALQTTAWQIAHPTAATVGYLLGGLAFGILGLYWARRGEKIGLVVLGVAGLLVFGCRFLTQQSLRFLTLMPHSAVWTLSWRVSLMTAGTIGGFLALALLWSAWRDRPR